MEIFILNLIEVAMITAYMTVEILKLTSGNSAFRNKFWRWRFVDYLFQVLMVLY